MLQNTTIKKKLFLLAVIPALAFLLFAGNILYVNKNKLDSIGHVNSLISINNNISSLILNLQRERGLSLNYLQIKDKETKLRLVVQQSQSNKFLKTFQDKLDLENSLINNLKTLSTQREDIRKHKLKRQEIYDFYSNLILQILTAKNNLFLVVTDEQIARITYQNSKLLIAIENASQEIAILNNIFLDKNITIEQFIKFSFVHIKQLENLNTYQELLKKDSNTLNLDNKKYSKYTDIITDQLSSKKITKDTHEWHKVSTKRLVKLIIIYNKAEIDLTQYIKAHQKELFNNFILTLFSIIIIFLIILILSHYIVKSFLSSLYKLSHGIDDFILLIIYRDRKINDIEINSNDEIGDIARNINYNRKLIEACFKCDERVINEVSQAVRNAKNDIHLVQEIKCFADNVLLENMKFDFNEMMEILRLRTDELALYDKKLEKTIKTKTSELERVNENLQVSYKVLEDEKIRLNNFSDFLSSLNTVDIEYLANKTLEQVFNISEALLGYFLIYEDNALKILSSKAIDKNTLNENSDFILSSPLLLESLQENKIISIEDIPAKVLKPINIGFASINLHNFYAFPLVFQDKPLGSIILASAKVMDKDYIQGYIHALTSSLNNALSYNYIQHQSVILEKANVELQESDKMKSEFLANMSHELRTPLNSIIGFSSILKKNKKENLDIKQIDQVKKINNNGRHLLELINNILDLSKIESGKLEVDPRNIDIIKFVQDTVDMIQGQVDIKNAQLIVKNHTSDKEIIISIDEIKLRQVLLNIIGNALKFIPQIDGHIEVNLYYKENKIFICIKDNGIGIPKDKLKLIFEPFRQADGSTTRKFGGTGLGLAISKNIIDLLEGELIVDSVVGEGSTFCIVLPKINLIDEESKEK